MNVGRSVNGRSIIAERIGARAPVLLFGGIHGDEPASVRVCQALLASSTSWSGDSLLVVPALNPDGLAAGKKNNARDVDLNRNFPARSWSHEHRPGYFPGAAPLSEPEAETLAHLVRAFCPRLVISIHQPFGCVNFDGPAEPYAAQLAAALGWPLVPDLGYATPGSFGTWWGQQERHPTLTLELPGVVEDAAIPAIVTALQSLCRGEAR